MTPCTEGAQPSSWDMGRMATLMQMRSMLQSIWGRGGE